jgi:osmotically-inducible protein OsmY
MSLRKNVAIYPGVCILFLLLTFSPGWAQSTAQSDNSKMNKGDQSASAVTADQQNNNRSDTEITKEIRRSLTEDKSLSTYAHNVKVITQNGKVTLKGPVRSDDEKSAVMAKASQVAGQSNINDEMTVAPKH